MPGLRAANKTGKNFDRPKNKPLLTVLHTNGDAMNNKSNIQKKKSIN